MKWLLENPWLKLAAFAMAFLVWIHVATEKTYNYELKLPITEISLKDDLTLSRQPPGSLMVAVSATGKQLLRQRWRLEGLRINATQCQAGRYNLPLSTGNTSLAHLTSDITLDEVISPPSILLEIDAEGTATVAVILDIRAVPDEGFAMGIDTVIVPDSVTLTGPRSSLARFPAVFTEQKQLTGLRNNVSMMLPLVTPPGYGFQLSPDSVAVTVKVMPVKTRMYTNLPILVFHATPGSGVTPRPAQIDVELTGPPDQIDKLDPTAVTVSIDVHEMTVNGRAPIRVDCPPGYRVKSMSADSARIIQENNAGTRN
ncbi:MAG: hypothetical protein KKA42_16865 [candidate division Zixibacteria bacterium]|nr:hypothetical protein [candidate division Zixibacteria bacterium]